MSRQLSFMNRRVHSLLGIIPVGFFLLEHLLSNYYATKGIEAYVKQVEWIQSLPFVLILEIVFIFLPLLYHGIYGLYVVFKARNNIANYGTFRNVMFALQRITGVITLVFVFWHVYETRIQVALHNYTASELAHHTSGMLQNNMTFVLYIIGVVSAIYHFSNGMWSFLVSWGVTVGPRSQLVSTWVWGVVFLLVSYIGISSLLAFHSPDFVSQSVMR